MRTSPNKMTKSEATQAVITAARAVLVAHEAAFNAGHGVGTAKHERIMLQVALRDLDAADTAPEA